MKTKIQILRELKKMSRRELARRSGLTDTTIRRLENDPDGYRSATLDSLSKIAKVYQIPVTDLIDEALLK